MEKAPKDGRTILAYDGETYRVVWWHTYYPYLEGVWAYAIIMTDHTHEVKHIDAIQWMPLPPVLGPSQ
jgi:hypothetical protein